MNSNSNYGIEDINSGIIYMLCNFTRSTKLKDFCVGWHFEGSIKSMAENKKKRLKRSIMKKNIM